MDLLEKTIEELTPRLGEPEGDPAPLDGGITNRNFRARFGGSDVVIRLPGKDTEQLSIDRGAERVASETAARVGVGPEVVAMLADPPCLVTRFIVGEPMSAEQLREPATLAVVAAALRAVHGAGELPVSFDSFRIVEEYAERARGRGATLPEDYEWGRSVASGIEAALSGPEHEPVPCHDDLLAANFLRTADGLRIVDWEYAGMGDRYFDLGNFAVNNDLDEAAETALLDAYFGEPPTPGRLASLRLMRFMSDFREAMWGVLQGTLSDLDFDFSEYAAEHFGRMRRTAADPGFETWLKEAGAAAAELPDRARCVIVGGGVGGASLAYHLAKLGWDDVVLLERSQLTSGSTFHSAGLVGQLRGSVSLTKMMMHSVELYRRLKDESEFDPGWTECGGIRLASSEERLEELRRQAGWAKTFGLPLELISAEEAKEMFPLMSTEGVLGAAWLPTDGYIDPSQLTFALADGARQGGCRTFTSTRVTGIDVRDGRVRGVRTDRGEIEAEVVVDAGGMFAAEIARMAGVRVPAIPMSHQYLVTQPFRERGEKPLPTLRDPDLLIYYREEGGGLIMGGYERRSEPAFMPDGPAGLDRIPYDFNGRLLEEEWDRFEEIIENSKRRVPVMDEVTVTKLINGPEAFTPDNEFCLGETEVGGFFVCACFCAHGLAGAGGIGKVMAEWIAEGEPSLDLWEMDIRRFGAQYRSPSYTHARIKENYETYYDIRYPNHERQAGRPLRVSPINAWHHEHDAAFGEKSGWERVNWYERNAAAGDEGLRPRGWAGQHWSPAIGAEHRATREGVAIFDESSFAKLEIEGAGAAGFLEGLCDNRVAREAGKITYTQMLNTRGGIECDFTVARLAEDRFSIVTGTAFGNHDREWMRRHLPADGGVRIGDVTSARACIGIWGPRAREVLAPLTPYDLGDEAFPYMSVREITVGDAPVRALRVTYVGELGWELYCPTEYGLGLWRAIWEAGQEHGIVAGGYRAIDSMRLEKGYRVWGADITPDETPYEGGVGFCVKLDKDGGFIGREALLEAKERGPRTRLRCLTLEHPHSIALGNEPVRAAGEEEILGRVTTGGYGYTVERSIAYAYLPPDRADPGTAVEVEIFGRWTPGEVASEPLFDPEGERVRG